MKSIEEALRWLFESVGSWLKSVTHPVVTLNQLLASASDEKDLSAAAKIWIPAIMVGVVFSLPVLNLYGIKWDSVGYHLSYWLAYTLALLTLAFVAHATLVTLRLRSEFLRTLVMIATPIMTYAPINYLANLPQTLQLFGRIKAFKDQKIPVDTAIGTYFHDKLIFDPPPQHPVLTVLGCLTVLIACGAFVVSAEAVSQWYGNDRFRSYSALAVSLCFGLVVMWGLLAVQFLAVYSFLG